MDDSRDTLRTISWSEIFPWLSLFRTFRLAIGFRALVLSAVGLIAMLSGWALLTLVFGKCPASANQLAGHGLPGCTVSGDKCPFREITGYVPDRPGVLEWFAPPAPRMDVGGPDVADRDTVIRESITLDVGPPAGEANPILLAWQWLSRPVLGVFAPGVRLAGLIYLVLAGLWGVAVWAFFGAAVTRIAAVQLACEERLSWGSVLRHASRKWLAYVAAPLFPLVGVALCATPLVLFGMLVRAHLGLLLVVLWPLALVAGLLMAVLLLGLIFGWPLMWATISTEGSDSFDALSRSYAYVFQRPLHYLFYLIVAGLFGALGWILVSQFAAGVIWLSYWAVGWGSGSADPANYRAGVHLWVDGVKILAFAFVFSYFWIAMTAIYALLRRSVDATEMDEVFLEGEGKAYGLPPLKTEGPDAPAVVDTPADSTEGAKQDNEE